MYANTVKMVSRFLSSEAVNVCKHTAQIVPRSLSSEVNVHKHSKDGIKVLVIRRSECMQTYSTYGAKVFVIRRSECTQTYSTDGIKFLVIRRSEYMQNIQYRWCQGPSHQK